MGTSIAACLLGAGHKVFCIEADAARLRTAPKRLLSVLKDARAEGLIRARPEALMNKADISGDYSHLKTTEIVVESTVEDLGIKRKVIARVEAVVARKAIIGSNTSAIPVTELQMGARHPERILGLHWAEPANITRFMEIICEGQLLRRMLNEPCAFRDQPTVPSTERHPRIHY